MKRFLYRLLLVAGFLLLPNIVALAQLATPQILSSNMVLQQGRKIPIWGTANPNERVLVNFGKQRIHTRADKTGKWMVELEPMEADKHPRQMIIKGKKTNLVYDNVVVGEVWLCSGQSNMAYRMKLESVFVPPAKGEDLAALELLKPRNEMIRVFTSRRNNASNSWAVADGKSLADVSAAGYFFGKAIQEQLDVPVGIITAALGGTRIETWTTAEAYTESSFFGSRFKDKGKIDGLTPGQWYKTFVAPLIPFAVKGFLWYQGENNCGIGDRQYAEKYQVLVNSWRNVFHLPDAPFYSVLLGTHIYSDRLHRGGRPITAEMLPLFREQQIKSQSMIPNSDYIVISDLVDNLNDIHPSYKWEVGKRLARLALAKDYGFADMEWSGPRMEGSEVVNDSIVVSFSHVGTGLGISNGKRLTWFEIAAADGVFRPALADIKGQDKVVVYHPEIKQPVKVRFGWHETAIPNLVNSEGLPAVPFSTRGK